MIVRNLVNNLMQHVREGELCSCPLILHNGNKVELAIFTYFASEKIPQTVFGYGRLIHSDGEIIKIDEKELFQSEDELIVINELPVVSIETHEVMYDNYYQELQNAINSIKANNVVENVEDLRKAFKAIIPADAIELYRRICPSFLEFIKEENKKEKLLRIDRKRGKAVVLQTTVDEDGAEISEEVEMELPPMKMVEGIIKKVKIGEDGRTIETERKIYTPSK